MDDVTNEQASIRDLAREFVRKEIAPFAARWDREGTVPVDTVRRAGALGFFGVTVSAEWGGAGADFLSYFLMIEELAYGDAGICNMISATNAFAWKLRDFGTPAQKARFLRPVASGEALACLLFTEPQAGSDAANQQTRAVRRGDRFIVNGTKSFITSGRSAAVGVLLAVTDPAAGKRGISAFLVRTDAPGYRVMRLEDKLGHRTNDTCQIALEDLEVPVDDMLGPPGHGLKIALTYLDTGRIGVAAQSVGVARAALDAALRHARERETFGKKLVEHQAVAFMLADMATDLEAARQLGLRAARLKQTGVRCVMEASMSKLFASRMCERVCSAAIQVHGGYGYVADYPVEKLYRDARVFQIYDGTSEVQKMLIARELIRGS